MTGVRATTVRELLGAGSTADGEHVIFGVSDVAGKRHVFAMPRDLAVQMSGHFTEAIKHATAIKGLPGHESVAVRVQDFQVSGSEANKLTVLGIQIAKGSVLEFGFTVQKALDLSSRLATAASLLQAKRRPMQ
jgi:hypothetical protein